MNARKVALAALVMAVSAAAAPDRSAGLSGTYRAVLTSPGGELPFRLTLQNGGSGPGSKTGRLTASVQNGPESIPFSTVEVEGETITLRFDGYDSEIVARVDPSGGTLRGAWSKQAGKARPSMPFVATRDAGAPLPRFGPRTGPPGDSSVTSVTGAWEVVFKGDDGGETAARAEFEQKGAALLGTFLTPTGDYRFLEGDYGDGVLRLSCFDGGHAFLFVARAQKDGSLAGDFWSRTASHETWRATRAKGAASAMPDSFGMTTLRNPTGRLRFTFPDLDGHPVSLDDARFHGKVVLVDLFGSWCPNCNDQAPVLEELMSRYHDRGLEIVGLAYEMTGEPERDAVYIRKYAERHHITYPLLLAGTSDKAEASETLPDLSGVLAFPTLVFVARDGSVKAIHTGFEGPGTGPHFTALKAKYVALIEELLAAPLPR